MKSITLIPLSAIILLGAMTLVGCNKTVPGDATDASATNSVMSGTNSLIVQTNTLLNTNNLAEAATNMAASTNQ